MFKTKTVVGHATCCMAKNWIPAFAGMTKKKKKKEWIPAFAGMTLKKPVN